MKSAKSTMTGILVTGIIGILIGLFMFIIPVNTLLKILFVVFGIMMLISGIPSLIHSLSNKNEAGSTLDTVISLISVILGVILIFWHNSVVMIVCGIYLLALPVIRIFMSDNKKLQLRRELPRMILGVVMIIAGPGTIIDLLLKISGGVIILLAVLYMIFALLSLKTKTENATRKTGGRVFADTTGDGKIDTVFVDTTGDGKVDTGVNIDEDRK